MREVRREVSKPRRRAGGAAMIGGGLVTRNARKTNNGRGGKAKVLVKGYSISSLNLDGLSGYLLYSMISAHLYNHRTLRELDVDRAK